MIEAIIGFLSICAVAADTVLFKNRPDVCDEIQFVCGDSGRPNANKNHEQPGQRLTDSQLNRPHRNPNLTTSNARNQTYSLG